jgi:Amt family ammonium transporter
LGGGFVDVGGAGCIQATGGLTALAMAWIIGPRRGRFTTDGIPTAMPGHNSVIVLFGCLLALVGFLGLNSAGAVLFAARTPAQTVLVDVNTTLAAAAAALAALATTRIRFGRPDASLTANGWVTGLVASSAGCAFVKPAEAVLIGFIAGVLVIFAVDLLESRMKIDDPSGAIAVHAGGAIWGLLAVGIFGRLAGANVSGQFLAQVVGIATLLGLVLPLTYGLNRLLNRMMPQRVTAES